MKNSRTIQIVITSIIAIVALTLNSCKKKDADPPAAPNGTIAFHIHTNVDTTEVDNYDSINVMSNHRKISVHKAQLYISGIQLVKLDGTIYNIDGVIKLKKQETENYIVASAPVGNYATVKFNVGLDATTNASTPAAADSTLNQPQMWFGSTAQLLGYVFVNFQGLIDTTTAANGSIAQMQPFSYKIGTETNLKTVSMPNLAYTISSSQVQFIHMIIDYNKLFHGIQLNENGNLIMNTTVANSSALGTQITNNIPLMFSYEMY
jgi:hypothetical protein